jgi:hypothetical protein
MKGVKTIKLVLGINTPNPSSSCAASFNKLHKKNFPFKYYNLTYYEKVFMNNINIIINTLTSSARHHSTSYNSAYCAF